MHDIRIYLEGLIRRDVSVGTPIPDDDPYWQTPEGKKAKSDAEARRKAYENDDLRLVSLTESGSIKYVQVDRAAVRKLMIEGWTFDDDTTKWANEK